MPLNEPTRVVKVYVACWTHDKSPAAVYGFDSAVEAGGFCVGYVTGVGDVADGYEHVHAAVFEGLGWLEGERRDYERAEELIRALMQGPPTPD